MKNVIARVMNDSNKDKRFFSALVRLKKNGRFSRVNGKVYTVKHTQDGRVYAVIDNLSGTERENHTRKWQTIGFDQILQVRKDGFLYKKI